jgi:TIR domain
VRRMLIDAVLDPGGEVREAAIRVLCGMAATDGDIRGLVAEWAASAPDATVRMIAGQALSWLPGADVSLLPDLGAEPEPAAPTESTPAADATEVALPQLIAQLGTVFRQTGLPTHTFVEPPDFHLLQLALSLPGLGIVIEGPSGIGKTTLVHACLTDAKRAGYQVEELSGRITADLPRLAEIAANHPHGIVVVDDFHRLPADLRGQLTDHLKLLADRGDDDRRLIVIGIPETGHNLIRFGHDLTTRIQVIPIDKAPYDLVLKMIRQGEKALNVTFSRADEIAREAAGSLNVAQILCLHTAYLNGVTATGEQHRTITEGVDRALGYVDRLFTSTYRDLIRTFCGLDGEKRRTCIDLLLSLARTDGSLALDEMQGTDAGVARDIRTLLERFPEGFDGAAGEVFKDHLFLDVQSRQLVVEDPKLLFHLRQRQREELIRSAGKREMLPRSQIFVSYSHDDQDWLIRLRKHLAPLKARDYVDPWDDKDLNPGDRWRDEIENALDRTKIAILMITQNFLDSAFITEVELPKLLAASRTDGCRIWPLIIAPSVYEAIPELAEINTFNTLAEPLTSLSVHDQERILSRVAMETMKHFPA